MEQAGPKRLPNAGSFKPGVSGNPGGRPRSALAWSDIARRRIDPDRAFDLLERYLADETVPLERRLSMLLQFQATGFVRPPTTTAAQVHVSGAIATGADGDRPFAELDADALHARLAAARAAALRIALPSSIPDEEHSP